MITGNSSAEDGLLYILLPVHNRRAVTEKFVRCLIAQRDQNYHLVLIDDGSSDGTHEMVKALIPGATVLHGDGNWWWSGSLQQGFKWLRTRPTSGNELVLIVNDDTTFDQGFIAAARAVLRRHARALLLAQQYSEHSRCFVEAGVRAQWKTMEFFPASDPAEINCFPTRGLFMRLTDFLALNGFYPFLLPHYHSDYEFTMRAAKRGYKLISDPSLKIWIDELTTGIHRFEPRSLSDFLKKTFSKKSATNPIYLSTFVLLSCPWRFVPVNLIRVWRGFVGAALRSCRAR